MIIKNINNKKNGFTLLETLVAVFVLTFSLLGPLTLASYSLRSASLSQNQLTAFYLAQEAMEFIKNKRDTNAIQGQNWLSSLNSCRSSNGCYVDIPNNNIQICSSGCPKIKYESSSGFYNHTTGEDTIFTRQIKLSQVSSYEEKVVVTISWQERFGNKSIVLEENILNWP